MHLNFFSLSYSANSGILVKRNISSRIIHIKKYIVNILNPRLCRLGKYYHFDKNDSTTLMSFQFWRNFLSKRENICHDIEM